MTYGRRCAKRVPWLGAKDGKIGMMRDGKMTVVKMTLPYFFFFSSEASCTFSCRNEFEIHSQVWNDACLLRISLHIVPEPLCHPKVQTVNSNASFIVGLIPILGSRLTAMDRFMSPFMRGNMIPLRKLKKKSTFQD